MSTNLPTVKQIEPYGMRLINSSDFDITTMIDVTLDVDASQVDNNKMIVIPLRLT